MRSADIPASEVVLTILVTVGEYTLFYFALCTWKSLVHHNNLRGITTFRVISVLVFIGIGVSVLYLLCLPEAEGPLQISAALMVVASEATALLAIYALLCLAIRVLKWLAHTTSPAPPKTFLDWWSATEPRKKFFLIATVAIILIALFHYIFSQNPVSTTEATQSDSLPLPKS